MVARTWNIRGPGARPRRITHLRYLPYTRKWAHAAWFKTSFKHRHTSGRAAWRPPFAHRREFWPIAIQTEERTNHGARGQLRRAAHSGAGSFHGPHAEKPEMNEQTAPHAGLVRLINRLRSPHSATQGKSRLALPPTGGRAEPFTNRARGGGGA